MQLMSVYSENQISHEQNEDMQESFDKLNMLVEQNSGINFLMNVTGKKLYYCGRKDSGSFSLWFESNWVEPINTKQSPNSRLNLNINSGKIIVKDKWYIFLVNGRMYGFVGNKWYIWDDQLRQWKIVQVEKYRKEEQQIEEDFKMILERDGIRSQNLIRNYKLSWFSG